MRPMKNIMIVRGTARFRNWEREEPLAKVGRRSAIECSIIMERDVRRMGAARRTWTVISEFAVIDRPPIGREQIKRK